MDKYQLFRQLLPSLFPLIVFIVVDEFFGTQAGLLVAVSFGIAQLLFSFIKNKVFDKFTFFDTLLIVILGGVSYVLENEIFFKLKPALVGVILCVLLGVSAFSRLNVFAMMSKRYFDGITLNDEQVRQFTRSLKVLFGIFLIHTGLVLYSAFYMSKEAWAFISTVLFYLLFGAYVAFEVGRNWLKNRTFRKEEWLPLVDEKGKIVGKAPRSAVHQNKELLHPVVHMHVINGKREVYLQKRAATKAVQPGKWDTAVGGHVMLHENVETALHRETEEELGIRDCNAVPVCQYVLKMGNESELVFLHYTRYDGDIRLNAAEAEDGRFWTVPEVKEQLGKGVFTPSFEIELPLLRKRSIL